MYFNNNKKVCMFVINNKLNKIFHENVNICKINNYIVHVNAQLKHIYENNH